MMKYLEQKLGNLEKDQIFYNLISFLRRTCDFWEAQRVMKSEFGESLWEEDLNDRVFAGKSQQSREGSKLL